MTEEEQKQEDKVAYFEEKYQHFTHPKKELLIAMAQTMGNVSESCKRAGVKSRKSYYNYYENDEDFRDAIDDIDEGNLDFAESMLKRNIKNGSDTALIFFLKTKGKKRGYQETTKTELTGPNGGPIQTQEITIEL